MMQHQSKADKNREGIAIIMVIGLLALMMILGVAFAIYMRTGRMAAGNFKNDVVTRQLLPVALNQALQDMEAKLGASVYPDWDVLASSGSDNALEFTNASTLNWIPQGILAMTNPIPKWIPVPNDGRVAYLVLNCSGLLDANYAGGGATRGFGTNVSEIQVSTLAEVNDYTALANNRNYETIQELGVKGSGASPAPLKAPPSSLVTYSFFPWVYGGVGVAPVSLDGGTNTLIRDKAKIKAAFIASGIAPADAENVYLALYDYEDEDDIPQNLGTMCTESVPMFNEVGITLKYESKGGTKFKLKGEIDVEWIYPFVKATSKNYYVDLSVDFTGTPGFPLPAAVKTVISAHDYDPSLTEYSSVPTPYGVPTYAFGLAEQDYAAYTNQENIVTGRVSLLMRSGTDTGPVVDAVPTNTVKSFLFVMKSPKYAFMAAANKNYVSDKECFDPRYNWDPSASYWKDVTMPSVPSLGFENNITKAYRLDGIVEVDKDESMYVANRPLQSIAELSYLPRISSGTLAFWKTIRIFPLADSSLDRVLDYFTLTTNSSLKGVVNPNTRSEEVMKALFTGMTMDEYPGGPGTPVDAQALASAWVSHGNPIATLSDLGQKCTNMISGTAFRQESILRNTVGLLHTRQNYFLVLLCGQTARTLPGGKIMPVSSVHGIAEVWRDPLGSHATFIRMLKPLDD
ncbi:MAG: hypothetical protein WCS52_02855 [bacterium]